MGELGTMYAVGSKDGGGLPQDLDLAVDLLERAAELGDAPALNSLAFLYQTGSGVDRDEGKAAGLFKEAAMKDHPEALFHYGERMLEEGDVPAAVAAYHRAGELGFIYGAYKEGMLYMEGVGDDDVLPRSCPAAVEAFKVRARTSPTTTGLHWGGVAAASSDNSVRLCV